MFTCNVLFQPLQFIHLSRDKVIFNWAKPSIDDINEYCANTYNNFATIDIVPAIKCTNVNCTSIENRHQIDLFYSQICDALQGSSSNCIPSSKPSDSYDYIPSSTWI